MINNLPIKQGNSFWIRIKILFKKLFKKQSEQDIVNYQTEEKTEDKEKLEHSIKVEVKNDYLNDIKRDELLDYLEKNPKLLFELPVEKLKKIEKYYKESIKDLEEKLTKIKKGT